MHRFRLLVLAVLLPIALNAGELPDFDRFFTSEALRVDFFHTGSGDDEILSLDEIIREPFWAGNPRALIDTMNLGGYLFRVFDLETNVLIYSRGYCTIFGEWSTTDEAAGGVARTFHESIIMPFPVKPVQIRIDRRNRQNVFKNLFDIVVDPSDCNIRARRKYSYLKVRKLEDNGPPGSKVDLVILGDGYTKNQIHKLRDDAKRFIGIFFDTEPFMSRQSDFNVRLIETVSEESGVDDPRERIYRGNLLDLSYNSLGIDRYMLTTSNKILRDIAAVAPYDYMMILANGEKYGGGGIFNLFATCVSDNEYDGYIFVHEFGHMFGGLADEYYSSSVTYNDMYPRGVEPWEPNITSLLDTSSVKWGDLITEGTPVPTPDDSTYAGVVGCFEGAGYSAEGLYRPCQDCRMFSKGLADFCPVCRRAIEKMIDFHTR